MYVIFVERKEAVKEEFPNSGFWSSVTGLFSTARMAVKYPSIETARPTLEWLREECPHLTFDIKEMETA